MISRRFIEEIKLNPEPQYKLAWKAELNPVVLSQIITGYIRPKRNDPRVVRVGRVLGLSAEECFEEDAVNALSEV